MKQSSIWGFSLQFQQWYKDVLKLNRENKSINKNSKVNWSSFKSTKINPEEITIIWWNCRSLTTNKQRFIEYLTWKYRPDIIIIVETWSKSEIKLLNDYDVFQTTEAPYQGVWLIWKKGLVKKVFKNEEPYFIVIQCGLNPNFIIGAYFKRELRRKILASIKNFIHRIRKSYSNTKITIFWDLNPDRNFTIEMVKKQLLLETSKTNLNLITRKQKFKDNIIESWLDYLLSSNKITHTQTIENFCSDHIPILFKVMVDGCIKIKSNFVIKKLIIDKKSVKIIIQNENWPDNIIKENESLIWKKTIIRPSIKINSRINEVFEGSEKWFIKRLISEL